VNGTWAADPWGRYPYRWFDGTTWTALVFDGATQYLDPYVTQVRLATGTGGRTGGDAAGITGPESTIPIPIDGRVSVASAPSRPDSIPPHAAPTAASHSGVVPPPRPTLPPRAAAPSAAAARATVAAPDEAAPTRRTKQCWVPVVGSILVVGFAWWLFNLRDSGDRAGPVIAEGGTATSGAAEEVPVGTTAPVLEPAAPADTTPVPVVVVPAVDDVKAALVQDCVDSVPFAAYIGDASASDLWNAAGLDYDVLRSLCSALPDWRLTAIATQRDQMALYLTGSTVP